MRNPHGYTTVVGDLAHSTPTLIEQGLRHTEAEIDTFTCGHCNRVRHVPPKTDAANLGGLCRICDAIICPKCVDKGVCTPWEQKMERMERRQRLYDAIHSS